MQNPKRLARLIAVLIAATAISQAQTVQQKPSGEVTTPLSNGIPYSCDTLKTGAVKCGLGTDIRDRDDESACWSAIKAAKKSRDFTNAHRACDDLRDAHSRDYYAKKLAKLEAK